MKKVLFICDLLAVTVNISVSKDSATTSIVDSNGLYIPGTDSAMDVMYYSIINNKIYKQAKDSVDKRLNSFLLLDSKIDSALNNK